jgi:hypothetical protein
MATPSALQISDGTAPEIERLRATATRLLGEHVNDAGLCAVCGSSWPCERVLLADTNLAAT